MIKNNLLSAIIRFFIYSLIVLVSVLAIYIDAQKVSEPKFGEVSFTEWAQNIYLFLSAIIYGYIAYRFPIYKKIAVFFSGFTVILLIREMDYYFDNLFHGAWFYFVLPILFFLLYLLVKERKNIIDNLVEYFTTSAFGILLSGSFSIFIFSRFFGKKKLWMSLLETPQLSLSQRWVKNCAEEGSELFGYTLFFIAALEVLYILYHKRFIFSEKKLMTQNSH